MEQTGKASTEKRSLKLKVASFKKKKRRTLEANFERTLAAALGALGHRTWHMSCREAGWPDRYGVRGDTMMNFWIEVKSLDALTDNQLLKEQIIKLNELTKAGIDCYYCAKFEDTVILMNWPDFRDALKLDCLRAERYAYRNKKDLKEAIRYVLG